jgi:hypothetical protein
VGACQRTGAEVCDDDGLGMHCSAVPGDPSPDICNGIDDDCNPNTPDGIDDHRVGQNCMGTGHGGGCGVTQCTNGEITCGNLVDYNFQSDPDHCGDCTTVCATIPAGEHATRGCVNGTCTAICDSGWQTCGAPYNQGCPTSSHITCSLPQ